MTIAMWQALMLHALTHPHLTSEQGSFEMKQMFAPLRTLRYHLLRVRVAVEMRDRDTGAISCAFLAPSTGVGSSLRSVDQFIPPGIPAVFFSHEVMSMN